MTVLRPTTCASGLMFVLAMILMATPGLATGDQAELHRLRAARRAAVRAHSLAVDKGANAGRFGLLVIPVDFADTRLPEDWDNQALSQRLVPDSGETLHNYFRIASGARLDLDITVAPVIHLLEKRRLYSDRDLNGFTRTRKLATESLTAVRDLGFEFRRFDNDGPDGVAGTADDDGFVDGVLILHAGPGNENDPQEGLIQALQFFLEEPVDGQGVAASFYAVASLRSGPGIWAHETAHLLGLEDRYDPLLQPTGESEVRSRGGLGRFSLMASGAWGTGAGYGASLPDAYSAAQIGWYQVRNLAGGKAVPDTLPPGLLSGEVGRVWTAGQLGTEFFMLETREPTLSAPFDADVPGGQMLIYHVDETVPEASWHDEPGGGYHLRVRLVEADADLALEQGLDAGRAEDLYPGPLNQRHFGLFTIPSSSGYYGFQSKIALTDITATAAGVLFNVSVDTRMTLTFDYGFAGDQSPLSLRLEARETGVPLEDLTCTLRALPPAHGSFVDTGIAEITFPLVESAPGVWTPADPIAWNLIPSAEDGYLTQFEFTFVSGATTVAGDRRDWVWQGVGQTLDFRDRWPGEWVVQEPDFAFRSTTWYRWDTPPWLTANQDVVLCCVDREFATAAAWPNVTYGNSAHTTLTSAPLPASVGGVRLTHAIEVEMLTGQTAMDGGAVVWVGPDDQELPATPVGRYGGRVSPKSFSILHGRDAFVGADLALVGDLPQWRTDTFLVPTGGPGPWRLRLVFASNTLWRARGWFIADIEAIAAESAYKTFALTWDGDLHWSWPWPAAGDLWFAIESRADDEAPWQPVLDELFEPDGVQTYGVSGARILAELNLSRRQRHQVRVIGRRPAGDVASAAIVIYPDGGDGAAVRLGDPWPNPSPGLVRFLLEVPASGTGVLHIYGLRGRRIQTLRYGPGQHLAVWDGRDNDGARVAAGIYYLRLEGTGPVVTRKVVLIH